MDTDSLFCVSLYELFNAYLPEKLKTAVKSIKLENIRELEEIRIRSELPLMGVFSGYDRFIATNGQLSNDENSALKVTATEVEDLFYLLCEHSVYAYQEDIRRGYITLKGGHRAGICGTVVYDADRIKGMRDISSVNIRLARQIKGCSKEVFKYIIRNCHDIYNTLLISPPRCGKTTLLRDICRYISQGFENEKFTGLRTAVIDERSELAASYRGAPQNDLGPRTDVLDGCRKSEGIEIMLRGMSPHVIIMDELGASCDIEAVRMAWNAGVRIIATAHAFSLEDFKMRKVIGQLAANEGFERIILITMNDGIRYTKVMDSNGNELNILGQDNRMSYGICGVYSDRIKGFKEAFRETAGTS